MAQPATIEGMRLLPAATYQRACLAAYTVYDEALSEGRLGTALAAAVQSLTLAWVGFGDHLPDDAYSEMTATLHVCTHGDEQLFDQLRRQRLLVGA